MNAPLAEFSDLVASTPAEMRKCLRAIIEARGMSRRKVDEIAGLPIGYTDKLLCEPPVRNIGPTSFFPLLWALTHRIAFVPDPAAQRKIEAHHMFETRDERKARGDEHWRNAKAFGIVKEHAKQRARLGGLKRAACLPGKQRAAIARKAANARWIAYRRRLRLAAENAAT